MPELDPSYLAIYGRPLGGGGKRRAPTQLQRGRIMAMQGGACLYCGLPFGRTVARSGASLERRNGKRLPSEVRLRVNWDHFIPYAYLAANPGENWVAACQVCNTIKSARIFDTIRDAQSYILPRRRTLGYADPIPDLERDMPMPCLPDCTTGISPNQAHCTICHNTFSSVTGFDRHRKAGACLDPRTLGMSLNARNIWRTPMTPEQVEALKARTGKA